MKHLVIPDVQAKPGVSLEHLSFIGNLIVKERPEVVVCIGDFADMESLCAYDKGKKSFEGRRYKKDIAVAKEAMNLLLSELLKLQEYQRKIKRHIYKPRLVLTLGNHEERIERVGEMQPELEEVISYKDLPYDNWEVIDYLKPIEIDGVVYVHYLANPMSGKPYGGSALLQLTKVGKSFVVGHKQTLEIATRFTIAGKQQWGIICGACYSHTENYKGPQGNDHFRGLLLLHNVKDGNFSPQIISLEYLKEQYREL